MPIDGLADIDSKFTIHGSYNKADYGYTQHFDFTSMLSWKELFALIAPYLVEHPSDGVVKSKLASALLERVGKSGFSISINDQEFKTVTIQLKAYGLVRTEYMQTTAGGMALFWSLTAMGERQMMESRVIRESD